MALLPSDPAQQRKLLIGLIPVFVLFLYWYFLHGDYTAELASLRTRIETLDSQNQIARARAMRGGRELEERLDEFEEHIDRLERLVPSEEEVSGLLHQLAQRAEDTNCELARLTPGPEAPAGYYTRRVYDVVVFGSYHNVARFLADVGSLERIITPIDLALRDRNELDREGARRLEATFQIETYVLPPEGQVQQTEAVPT